MFDFGVKVLVVDDMMTMRKLVTKTCREIGFKNFVEASDGAKAWETLSGSDTPIGLIISDWNMPNSTGLDLLKRIRAESRFKQIPFLMVTAEAESHQVVDAVGAGVTEYLIKPFTKESMLAKLESAYKKLKAA